MSSDILFKQAFNLLVDNFLIILLVLKYKLALSLSTSNLFLALLGLQKDQNKQIIINNLIKYQNTYPKDIKGYLLLGEIYLRDELFIDAISYYYRALLLDNNNYDANYNLAICLIHLKKYNEIHFLNNFP